jgi:DNA-binding response OmpR family regulator
MDVLKKVKSDSDLKRVPVVMLSARGQEADISTGKEAGADFYFTKPFSPIELLSTVEKIFDTH